jgi:hypothetical protein
MADEMHRLQKDPPEGSRKVVERELKRQEHNRGREGPVEEGDKRREDAQDRQRHVKQGGAG